MAGITDRVFRAICRRYGADFAVTEMTSCVPTLRACTDKRRRLDISADEAPRVVQIAGGEARFMAAAARDAEQAGAQVIDINMGCPAKKVCKRFAGAALLRDEILVAQIIAAVVAAVSVPVTLKMRTGWDTRSRNALRIATIAEDLGVSQLVVHGRSRACSYQQTAEYDTIAAVVERVSIPVLANGDIDGPRKAAQIIAHTGAYGVMIGRAACGDPWIFARLRRFLDTQLETPSPSTTEVVALMHAHVAQLHGFYGDALGVRYARKHVSYYASRLGGRKSSWCQRFMRLTDAAHQCDFLQHLQANACEEMAA